MEENKEKQLKETDKILDYLLIVQSRALSELQKKVDNLKTRKLEKK